MRVLLSAHLRKQADYENPSPRKRKTRGERWATDVKVISFSSILKLKCAETHRKLISKRYTSLRLNKETQTKSYGSIITDRHIQTYTDNILSTAGRNKRRK